MTQKNLSTLLEWILICVQYKFFAIYLFDPENLFSRHLDIYLLKDQNENICDSVFDSQWSEITHWSFSGRMAN